jgi:hypothetical protein
MATTVETVLAKCERLVREADPPRCTLSTATQVRGLMMMVTGLTAAVGELARAADYLRQRVIDLQGEKMSFRGIHRDGDFHRAGDTVIRASALWVCTDAATTKTPGTADSGWKLCLKSPRQDR